MQFPFSTWFTTAAAAAAAVSTTSLRLAILAGLDVSLATSNP